MAGDWTTAPLASLCSYLNRGAAPAYSKGHGIVVLNQRCIRDQRVSFAEARRTDVNLKPISPDRILRRWDVLVNSTGVGTLGRVAQIDAFPEPATVDSHVTIARPNPEAVVPRYLGFVIRAFEAKIEALAEGSTGQTELSRSRLGSLAVPVAPGDEQRAVAHILGTLDDKIELNRRMNETLKMMARSLFKSWFVDFEPVRAKAEGRNTGLPKPLADLFSAHFVDSDLGMIPEGWGVETLADHFDAVKGVSYKGSGLGDDGAPLHNLNSIYEGGGYKYEGIKYYSGEYAERHVVRPGDLIVANTEQGHDRLLIGYAAIVPRFFGDHGIASHHIFRLRPKPSSPLTATFLCSLLNSPKMHDVVSGYANGTTVNMLPLDGVQNPPIVCPPKRLVEAFDALALNSECRREEMISESRTIADLRDSLLPKLVSGEIRVKDAKKIITRAV